MIPVVELNQYQEHARMTATARRETWWFTYVTAQIASEAGEFNGKYAKALRDEAGVITEERRSAMILELGDLLWYIAAAADHFDIDLSEVARLNIGKLRSRQERGKLHGDGDNR